jgi:hypothetical protein
LLVNSFNIDSIFEEIEKHNCEEGNEESELEKCNRMENIVFSQLLPIANNMLEFLDKEDIKVAIEGFSRQYNLSKELIDQLKIIIDDYQNKELDTEKMSVKDDNVNDYEFQNNEYLRKNKKIQIELTNKQNSTDDLKNIIDSYYLADK